MSSMSRLRGVGEVPPSGGGVLGALPVEVGPSAADLAAIEVEWPLIEAELAVVDAEIRLLACEGGPSVLDWRRLRRAQRQALRISAALKVARRNGGQVA